MVFNFYLCIFFFFLLESTFVNHVVLHDSTYHWYKLSRFRLIGWHRKTQNTPCSLCVSLYVRVCAFLYVCVCFLHLFLAEVSASSPVLSSKISFLYTFKYYERHLIYSVTSYFRRISCVSIISALFDPFSRSQPVIYFVWLKAFVIQLALLWCDLVIP